jgi:hypothetical protein
MNEMNEEHVIAAILTAGIVAHSDGGSVSPISAAELYAECLAELRNVIRPTVRESESN